MKKEVSHCWLFFFSSSMSTTVNYEFKDWYYNDSCIMYGNANEVSKKKILHAYMQLASLTFSFSLTTLIPSPQKQLHVTSFNILPISSETLFRNLYCFSLELHLCMLWERSLLRHSVSELLSIHLLCPPQ